MTNLSPGDLVRLIAFHWVPVTGGVSRLSAGSLVIYLGVAAKLLTSGRMECYFYHHEWAVFP